MRPENVRFIDRPYLALGPRQFGHTPQKKKRKSVWKLQVDKSKSKSGAISLSLIRDLSSFSTFAPPKCRSLLRFLLLISIFQQRSTKKKRKKKRAAEDKRWSVFAPLISGNYICWRGGKWSSPGGADCSRFSPRHKIKLQGKEKISDNNTVGREIKEGLN